MAFCSQMGTNKCASQAGMTAYGTRRHLYDPKTQTDKPYDQTTISLQMGTNKGASQVNTHSFSNAAISGLFHFQQILDPVILNLLTNKYFILYLYISLLSEWQLALRTLNSVPKLHDKATCSYPTSLKCVERVSTNLVKRPL